MRPGTKPVTSEVQWPLIREKLINNILPNFTTTISVLFIPNQPHQEHLWPLCSCTRTSNHTTEKRRREYGWISQFVSPTNSIPSCAAFCCYSPVRLWTSIQTLINVWQEWIRLKGRGKHTGEVEGGVRSVGWPKNKDIRWVVGIPGNW